MRLIGAKASSPSAEELRGLVLHAQRALPATPGRMAQLRARIASLGAKGGAGHTGVETRYGRSHFGWPQLQAAQPLPPCQSHSSAARFGRMPMVTLSSATVP